MRHPVRHRRPTVIALILLALGFYVGYMMLVAFRG